MNENNMPVYNTIPVVTELNRVPGFDPMRFVKQTPGGPRLELKYKKLWFRLKYPQGRIKLTALKVTDQLAIIEARIFFDKNDAEPRASFTARSDAATAPGGMYIEAAQHTAIDEALTDAGFGIQFAAMPEKAAPAEKTVQEKAAAAPQKPAEPSAQKPAPVKAPEAPEAASASSAQDAPAEPGYTNEMPVEAICAKMTLREAEEYIVPLGTCNGQTMSQVADRRPASLQYYISGYSGNNNILRAAATLVASARGLAKAG